MRSNRLCLFLLNHTLVQRWTRRPGSGSSHRGGAETCLKAAKATRNLSEKLNCVNMKTENATKQLDVMYCTMNMWLAVSFTVVCVPVENIVADLLGRLSVLATVIYRYSCTAIFILLNMMFPTVRPFLFLRMSLVTMQRCIGFPLEMRCISSLACVGFIQLFLL